MSEPWTRRRLLVALGAGAVTACASRPRSADNRPDPLADIEASIGGRVGVFAVDTSTGQTITRRADERFAMCSTFKWALVAAVLARSERGEVALGERVMYGEPDLIEYTPVTRAHVADGMTIEALAEAAVVVSDNTAANLLLAKLGGPAALTRFFREVGDTVTRLDRAEPELNSNEPADPRDTTSPRAMAGLMQRVLCGDVLSSASRERLVSLMRASTTGRKRLRAGLPTSWSVGDKTGTGPHGAVNDVAIAMRARAALRFSSLPT